MTDDVLDVRSRQDPLRKQYRKSPEDARITDRAVATGGTGMDPFHGQVVPGSEDHGVVWPFGIHRLESRQDASLFREFDGYGISPGSSSSRARSVSVPPVSSSSSSGVVANMLFVSPAAG
jgi:hypothetical protein